MKVKEIIEGYLQENGFSGLFNEDDECVCELDTLGEGCEGFHQDCQAGYINPCRCGDHDAHIGPTKENLCDDCVKDRDTCDAEPTTAYDEGSSRDDDRVIRCEERDEG